jgi:Leucine-rich repeat (LRR) protein
VQAFESKKPDKLDQWVVDLLFGQAHPPKVNLAWQPKRYTTWEEALKEAEKVEWLDLKSQPLSDFSEKIQPLSRVKVLELTGYGLREVLPGIEQVKKLSHLNLANNHLSDLPMALSQLPQLRELNI